MTTRGWLEGAFGLMKLFHVLIVVALRTHPWVKIPRILH